MASLVDVRTPHHQSIRLLHNPSHCTLQRAEEKENNQRHYHFLLKSSFHKKNDERNGEDNANQSTPQAVKPFPEKDEFEIVSVNPELSCLNCSVAWYFSNAPAIAVH
jgi:hypothetical protein